MPDTLGQEPERGGLEARTPPMPGTVRNVQGTAPPLAQAAGGFLDPLDRAYGWLGLRVPEAALAPAHGVPRPFHQLLVHHEDMTPTLEAHYGQSVLLRVLHRWRDGNHYYRLVTLYLYENELPVEFGAIRIHLDRFEPRAREHVLAERHPLGHILLTDRVVHACRPRHFLRVTADGLIRDALRLLGEPSLFGRASALLDPEGGSLAEVIELLPPLRS
jgi:chorismate-pyruvate lyase